MPRWPLMQRRHELERQGNGAPMGVSFPGSWWMASCGLSCLRPEGTIAAALQVSLGGERLGLISRCLKSVTAVTHTAMGRRLPGRGKHRCQRFGEVAALQRLAQHFVDTDSGG